MQKLSCFDASATNAVCGDDVTLRPLEQYTKSPYSRWDSRNALKYRCHLYRVPRARQVYHMKSVRPPTHPWTADVHPATAVRHLCLAWPTWSSQVNGTVYVVAVWMLDIQLVDSGQTIDANASKEQTPFHFAVNHTKGPNNNYAPN